MIHPEYHRLFKQQAELLDRPNKPIPGGNGVLTRWENPVLTRDHIPLTWVYDLDAETNPWFAQRLGINSTFNSGAIKLNGKYHLVARVEGVDRKSFFALATSDSPTHGFRFADYPVRLPDTVKEEVDVYDMRLTAHEDGWIYGVFCSEAKDPDDPALAAARASAGIVRTKDLLGWERLDNLVSQNSLQQRNVLLHPEFVQGNYAFYTRPMDSFIDTGSGGGIGFALASDIEHAVIDEEKIISKRHFHTITEGKNGAGAVPIKGKRGWLHIAHGVRTTAAGLRYVLYSFATALDDPARLIAEPGGYLLAPIGSERIGDVGDVLFTNGCIADEDGRLYLYYAASDTRLHVATTTIEQLEDYLFNTPPDALRSVDCVAQRAALIERNLALLAANNSPTT